MKTVQANIGTILVLLAFGCPQDLSAAQTITVTNGVQKYAFLSGATVEMSGKSELWVTNAGSPISGCVINLNSVDSWLFLPGVLPSVAASTYLSQVRVRGAAAIADSNVRVVQHGQRGAVVIPHAATFRPLQAFSGPHFTGAAAQYLPHTYYKGAGLEAMDQNIASFKLRRGYMAVLAQNASGSGISRSYVAQDGDLDIGALPADLARKVRFVYVTPWRWTSKKGIAGNIEGPLAVLWKYNWNIDQNSTRDLEYVPIRQNRYWPALNQNWKARGANTLLGYNEPDRPDQSNISVNDALAAWPDLLATGLRLGSPAPSDGGRSSWLYPFVSQADAAGLRVDFVAVHYYGCFNPANPSGAANQMYNFLLDTYNRVRRPIWITEWNNGANWTGCGDPTFEQQRACISAMIDMLETTPFVERYALFNWVEDARRVEWDDRTLTAAGVAYRDKISTLSFRQTMPDNGTRGIAQFHFDDDALDSSGYGNHAIAAGAPTFAEGQDGRAVVLDGANNSVQLPANIARGSGFTFAGWVSWKGGGNWQRIFDFGNDTSHYLFLTPSSSANTLRFAINAGGGEQIVQAAKLPIGRWVHVAVTLAGNAARLYVNGVLAASSATFTATPRDFAPMFNYLGKSQFPADPLFNGSLDDVQIADFAFTPSQIASMQTNSAPQFLSGAISLREATPGQVYSGSIAGEASDPNGEALAYVKVSGPGWLGISSSGAISGTPVGSDVGTNFVVARVTDSAGASAFTVLSIAVKNPVPAVQISASISENQLLLSWPQTGWRLQTQTNALSPTNWFDVPGANQNSIRIPIATNISVFYRLAWP